MNTHLKAYLFFKENAGYIVGKRAQGALAMAKAERWAKEECLEFIWETDPFSSPDDFEFEADKAHVREHDAVGCILFRPCPEHGVDCKHAEHLASLWGITESLNNRERDNYRRVVEAELALEAMPKERAA